MDENWQEQFVEKIKSKSNNYDRFSLLLCSSSDIKQRELLNKILNDDHTSVNNWFNYIEYTLNVQKDRANKATLLRLVNKSIECLEPVESKLKDNKEFIALHLHVASLQSKDDYALNHFVNKMIKKEIGKHSSLVYLRWSEVVLRLTDAMAARKEAAEDILAAKMKGSKAAIDILEKGIMYCSGDSAELFSALKAAKEHVAQLKQTNVPDDGVVSFQKGGDAVSIKQSKSKSTNSHATAADSDEDETMQVDTRASETTKARTTRSSRPSRSSAKSEDVQPVLQASLTGLSGKCSRVIPGAASNSAAAEDSDGEADTQPVEPAAEASRCSALSMSAKPADLSLYVDDKIKNFNPVWKPKATPSADKENVVVSAKKPLREVDGIKLPTVAATGRIHKNTPAKRPSRYHQSSLECDKENMQSGGCDELNDSVVEFKRHRRPALRTVVPEESSAGQQVVVSSSSRAKRGASAALSDNIDAGDEVVSLSRKKSRFSISTVCLDKKPPVTFPVSSAAAEEVQEEDDTDDAQTTVLPTSLNNSSEASSHNSSTEMSTEADTDGVDMEETVKLPSQSPVNTPPADSEANESAMELSINDMDTVQVPVPETALASEVHRPAPMRAASVETPAVSLVPAAPMMQSSGGAASTPATRKRRVSFVGGNDNEALQNEDPVVEIAKPIAAVRASTRNSNSVSSSSNSRNLFDDPSNHITVNDRDYLQLGVMGKGGSGVVTRIVAKDTGAIYAFKRIAIHDSGDEEEVHKQFEDIENEIGLLRLLKGVAQIIELVDYNVDREALCVSMVLELGEVDLAKVLSGCQIKGPPKASKNSNELAVAHQPHALDMHFARMIWKEMLECVQCIHDKNVIHGDLKPANFVFVKGHLKLIDFGIAKATGNDTTNVYKESQVGTLNYMSPESLMATDKRPKNVETNHNERTRTMCLGRSSDVWSLGCILYQMMYGVTPFAKYQMHQKFAVIIDPQHHIDYSEVNSYGAEVDPEAIRTIQRCLVHDRKQRAPITGPNGLLSLGYLTHTSSSDSHGTTQSRTQVNVNNDNLESVVNCVLQTLTTSATSSSITPRKKSKADAFLSVLGETNRHALVKSVRTALGDQLSQMSQSSVLNTSSGSNHTNTSGISGPVTGAALDSTSDASLSESQFVTQKIPQFTLQAIPPHSGKKTPSSALHSVSTPKRSSNTLGLLSSSVKIKKIFETNASISSIAADTVANTAANTAVNSGSSAAKSSRVPLKSLPVNNMLHANLQQQLSSQDLKSTLLTSTNDRAAKWMKPAPAAEKSSMQTAMEEKLSSMRRFICDDDENNTVTETMNDTGFGFF